MSFCSSMAPSFVYTSMASKNGQSPIKKYLYEKSLKLRIK